jgi:hypothetical protein
MRRRPSLSVIVVPLLLALLVGASTVARAADKGPCKIAAKGNSPTAVACASGGRDAATKVMKEMVKQAKAKGQKFTCDGCHKDLDNYELTKNANDDYKKLEAVLAAK